MEINKETKEIWVFAAICAIVISIFLFSVFGFTGFRVFIGIIFISLPFYFILNNFDLNEPEKFVFSMLLGFVLFSALAYWLGFLIPFKFAIIAVFVILMIISFIIKKFMPKTQVNQ